MLIKSGLFDAELERVRTIKDESEEIQEALDLKKSPDEFVRLVRGWTDQEDEYQQHDSSESYDYESIF